MYLLVVNSLHYKKACAFPPSPTLSLRVFPMKQVSFRFESSHVYHFCSSVASLRLVLNARLFSTSFLRHCVAGPIDA